ncbi:hypothetical protein [Metaclostridioides mangenotii]|nr:hypothetical protein [Clostridioides mangenotii]
MKPKLSKTRSGGYTRELFDNLSFFLIKILDKSKILVYNKQGVRL